MSNIEWLEWLTAVMACRPKGNELLDSDRGVEIGRLLALNEEMESWRRNDPDVFWIDVQLYTKYKLSDAEIKTIERSRPRVEQYKENANECHACAEMMRCVRKLRKLMTDNSQGEPR